MATRDEWAAEQARLMANYDEVRRELLQVPGVVEVGIGLRRRAGAVEEEAVYIVYVGQKLPPDRVPADELVPATVRGVPTDVQEPERTTPLLGFGDDEHTRNYGTKVGGIAINSDGSGGQGTLGCFCKLTSNGSTVLLSNHHVLLGGEAKIGSGVGQPLHSAPCCCTCNEIGKVLAGDPTVDCAIASLNADVPFFPKIRRIKRADGTVEEEGLIKGVAAPVVNQVVWKVGKRTGLTRGKITAVAPLVRVDVDAAFTQFTNRGDSGSVIVEKASGNVVALLARASNGPPFGLSGFGPDIAKVQTTLGITVIPSDPAAVYTEGLDEEYDDLFPLPAASPFDSLVQRLQADPAGRELLHLGQRHVAECLRLVNQRRGFTVAWHRNRGPTWLAALGRSSRDPIYRIPEQVDGVDRIEAWQRIGAALEAEASEELRRDLAAHGPMIFDAVSGAATVDEILDSLPTSARSA